MHPLERRRVMKFFFLASHRNFIGLVYDGMGRNVIKSVMCYYKLLILFLFF